MCALIPRHSIQLRILVREVQLSRLAPIDAEFVLPVARRNMRVPARFHIRVDARWKPPGACRRSCSEPRRLLDQYLQLRCGFHVEKENSHWVATNPVFERVANLVACFSHARKHDRPAAHADFPQPRDLAARTPHQTCFPLAPGAAAPRDSIRLHRVAQRMRDAMKRAIEVLIRLHRSKLGCRRTPASRLPLPNLRARLPRTTASRHPSSALDMQTPA